MVSELFGIFGNPVIHSLSPIIQNAAFRHLGIEAHYTRIAADSAEEIIEISKIIDLKGCNITAPFKEKMLGLIKADSIVEELGAVNTLRFNTDYSGDCFNSDVYGAHGTLEELGIDIDKQKILILGAGGAAKALLYALKSKKSELYLASIDGEAGIELASKYHISHLSLKDPKISALIKSSTLIINATSSSQKLIPDGVLKSNHIVIDAIYGQETDLITAAKSAGAKTVDGLRWLLNQAVASFKFFTGQVVPIDVMEDALRETRVLPSKEIILTGEDHLFTKSVGDLVSTSTAIKTVGRSDASKLNPNQALVVHLFSDNKISNEKLGARDLIIPARNKSVEQIADRIKSELKNVF